MSELQQLTLQERLVSICNYYLKGNPLGYTVVYNDDDGGSNVNCVYFYNDTENNTIQKCGIGCQLSDDVAKKIEEKFPNCAISTIFESLQQSLDDNYSAVFMNLIPKDFSRSEGITFLSRIQGIHDAYATKLVSGLEYKPANFTQYFWERMQEYYALPNYDDKLFITGSQLSM